MNETLTFESFKALSLDEQIEVFGGGGISDLVVKGLTWCGDKLSAAWDYITS